MMWHGGMEAVRGENENEAALSDTLHGVHEVSFGGGTRDDTLLSRLSRLNPSIASAKLLPSLAYSQFSCSSTAG